MFTRILLPTDLSPSSEAALEVARRHFPEASIRLLHIIDQQRVADTYRSTLASPVEVAEVRKKLEVEAFEKLRKLAKLDEEPMVVVSKAAEMILDHAEEWKPDPS